MQLIIERRLKAHIANGKRTNGYIHLSNLVTELRIERVSNTFDIDFRETSDPKWDDCISRGCSRINHGGGWDDKQSHKRTETREEEPS